MKLQKSSFKTETALGGGRSESLVEGKLSVPEGKSDIGRVLLVSGRVHANAEPGDGKVFLEGSVTFNIVYMDPEGSVESFETSSPFRHTENIEGAGAGMNVYVRGAMQEIEYTVENPRTLYVRGVASLGIKGTLSRSFEAVTGGDSGGMQSKMRKSMLPHTRDYKKDTVAVREDIRIPQSMPKAEKVLFADAYAVPHSLKTEDMKAIVEGDIKLMVLYLSEDKSAPLQHFYESIPFGEILSVDVSPTDTAMTEADLYDLNVEVAEAENDILRISAKVTVVCAAGDQSEMEHMEDAYSLNKKLKLKRSDHAYKRAVLSGCAKAFARTSVSLPPEMPGITRVICMKATPVVISVIPGNDRVYIEGLMMYNICYASAEGMQSYSGETPFEAEAQMEGLLSSHEAEAVAEVEYCSFEGAGREINVKFMMDVRITAYDSQSVRVVDDIEETEEDAPHRKGITIYFADGGESMWDIAKRYSTTMDKVKKFNPEMGESAEKGQKILIMG